jgi:hypothetical protein
MRGAFASYCRAERSIKQNGRILFCDYMEKQRRRDIMGLVLARDGGKELG